MLYAFISFVVLLAMIKPLAITIIYVAIKQVSKDRNIRAKTSAKPLS